jgi:DNA-binding response OmpR family regulator
MKILVVEDDRKVAGFIEQGLKEEGYAVDVARDGDEATLLAHVYDYDMILLDVVLPKKNGFQIAHRAPARGPEHADPDADLARCRGGRGPGLDAGADDYLSKPFRFDELLARSGRCTGAAARSGSRSCATGR